MCGGVRITARNLISIKMDKKVETEKQEKHTGFEDAVKPAIKWLAENCHPHMRIIIESNVAELLEGQKTLVTDEYLVD